MEKKKLTAEEKEFRRRVIKARLVSAWKKFYSNKIAIIFTALSVIAIAVAFVLLGWHLQGQDVGAILVSPLALFWYAILGVAAITAVYWLIVHSGKKED